MKLAFSTLACPDWSLAEIIMKAQGYGYDGIELRGIKGETMNPNCPELAKDKLKDLKALLRSKKLEIACVDTSCALSIKPELMEKNLEEARLNMQLASDLDCKYIRVFGGGIPEGKTIKEYMDICVGTFKEIAKDAKKYGVYALLETHDNLTNSKNLSYVINGVNMPFTGVVWDVFNVFSEGEKIPDIYNNLKKYVKHVHFKDGVRKQDKSIGYVLVGKGELPLEETIDILKKDNYQGYLSFEFEKKWHPEIEEPEVSLPSFPKTIKKFL